MGFTLSKVRPSTPSFRACRAMSTDSVLKAGKFAGMTFGVCANSQSKYCKWVLERRESLGPEYFDFVQYLLEVKSINVHSCKNGLEKQTLNEDVHSPVKSVPYLNASHGGFGADAVSDQERSPQEDWRMS